MTQVGYHHDYHWQLEQADQLVLGDNLGDVGLHPVQLGVLGGHLPVLAASHCVHNVLSEERDIIGNILENHWKIIGKSCFNAKLHTWMRAK